ncbi:CGH_1_HP_G0064680.mRNA.1.CDS.1 [Saccharomyces cerevisiae]|nr:CGH_1_HP_G0064680.mRNA.1.CDS.1 [Saccharomyces cerevisiae]CAI6851752.1 CGH_1_HP_G0064680.mRNA.1.CDS.1 [Saccharomyces cerevisiae]
MKVPRYFMSGFRDLLRDPLRYVHKALVPYMYSGTMLSQAGDQLRTILGHTFVLDKRSYYVPY